MGVLCCGCVFVCMYVWNICVCVVMLWVCVWHIVCAFMHLCVWCVSE